MQKLTEAILTTKPLSAASKQPERSELTEPRCCDDGWIVIPGEGAKQCDCLRRKILNRALDRIPAMYQSLRLDTIKPDTKRHKMQTLAVKAMRANPEGSYVFFGANGCGKSAFGWLLYRQAVESGRIAVGTPLSELLEQFRRYERDPDKLPDIAPADLRQNKRRYFVFLDEVEKARPSEFSGEMLFRLIDAIYSFNHQLVIASNLTADALSAHWSKNGDTYGPSIVRRIMEMEDGMEVPMF